MLVGGFEGAINGVLVSGFGSGEALAVVVDVVDDE